MAAIITDEFRENNIETFIRDVEDSPTLNGHNYYVGIGKTDPWQPISGIEETSANFFPRFPNGSIDEKDDIKNNLMTLIKIDSTDVHRLIPKVQYRTSEIYKVYDPTDPTCFDYDSVQNHYPCYATYKDADGHTKLYVCLGNNNFSKTTAPPPVMENPSVGVSNFPYGVKQNSTETDGYIWAYVDYLDIDDPNNLFADSKSFQTLTTDAKIDAKVFNQSGAHAGISDGRTRATRASAGLLYGFKIVSAGSGYPMPDGVDILDVPAKIVGERIKNASDDYAQERIGDAIQADEGNDVTVTLVRGDNGGKVQSVAWNLENAKTLGFGRTNTTDSTGSAVTGLSISDTENRGGIKRATLVITEPDFFEGGKLKAEIIEADIRPLIAPEFGFGHSVMNDMPSYYAGISADFEGKVGASAVSAQDSPPRFAEEALVDVSFRQVSLIREKTGEPIRVSEDDSPWPDPTITEEKAVNCLPYFFVPFKAGGGGVGGIHTEVPSSIAGKGGDGLYVEATTVSGGGEKPRAWVDKVSAFATTDPVDRIPQTPETDAGGGFRVYYHQNSDKRVNKIPFPAGSTDGVQINIFDSTGANLTNTTASKCFYTYIGNPEYERARGEVIFAENRRPIRRDSQQTEEVRLIIQF